MELNNVVPWGRSFSEYKNMFCLSEDDLRKSILGCGDGPASFNAELTEKGGSVISFDPTYAFSAEQIRMRIAEVFDEVMPQMENTKDKYIWESICSVEELGNVRMSAMNRFLSDYEQGKIQNRYVEESLPVLPFENGQFDLAVCSHYLFLYSEQVTLQEHIDSLVELTRVAKEVRIYPLLTLKGELSPHLQAVISCLSERGCKSELINSWYQFQKGTTQTLVVKSL